MSQAMNKPMSAAPGERPTRVVTVPDRFLSRLRAVLEAVLFHPFSTTIIRVVRADSRAD